MRKALNDNPVVQVVFIGILVLIVGFLFMTRVAGGGGSSDEVPPAADPAAASDAAIGGEASAPAAPTTVTPEAGAAAAPVDPAAAGVAVVPATPETGFVAGPGLPAKVADAYDAGKTIVLLIVHEGGTDDRKVRAGVESAQTKGSDVALSVVPARGIARYSRITQGVEVERVPALIVIRPKNLAPKGALPEATVSYGYRGPESIKQAVRDANYAGRRDIPYYPE